MNMDLEFFLCWILYLLDLWKFEIPPQPLNKNKNKKLSNP